MPGRKLSASISYRYGFNGKEEDDEVKGDGNQQDYGMRIYDGRLGRFLSVDPITSQYSELTPYQFASNRPIEGIDFDGQEFYDSKSCKVSVLVSYNPETKRIVEVTSYLIYNNVANGLKQKIHRHYQLPGNYYDENMNPGGIRVGNLNLRGIDGETFNTSPELQSNAFAEVEKEKTVAELKYEKIVKTSRISRIANPNAGRSIVTVDNSKEQGTASKIEAVVEATGKVIEIVYDFWEKNWEMSSIRSQSSLAVNNVSFYLNDAISKNMVPKEFLNENDLNSLGNYILYGEIPMTTSPSGRPMINENLLATGKSIWGSIHRQREEIKRKTPPLRIPTGDHTNISRPQSRQLNN